MPLEHKVAILRELGDHETADELQASSTTETKSLLGNHRELKPWEHTEHTFGFLPTASQIDGPLLPSNACLIEPDETLRGNAITVRLDQLNVADYPGKGIHQILFDFAARNSVRGNRQEHLRFNTTLHARDGQVAPTVGLPVFVNLNVGALGLDLKCSTVNVANEGSQRALDLLNSDLIKSGLKLTKTAQPAIGPLSQIALGMTKAILGASRNQRVQEFQLGLDFDRAPTGARLAEGSYIVVQVPGDPVWDWSDWVWLPDQARLAGKADETKPCPYNYLVFRITRDSETQ